MSVARTSAGLILADIVFAVAASVIVLPLVIVHPDLPERLWVGVGKTCPGYSGIWTTDSFGVGPFVLLFFNLAGVQR